MEILDMARQLGEAIRDSEVMARVKKAEEAQNNDDAAQKLIADYNLKRMQLAQRVQKENPSKEELEAIQKELSGEFDKLMQNKIIYEYIDARKNLDAIVNQVNSILTHFITGEEHSGCSSDCSSCHGCH